MRTSLTNLMLGVIALLTMASSSASERALDKEVIVHANVGQVWEAWTTREGIVSFMAPEAEIDAHVGGAFHVYFDPLAEKGLRGADDMRYMALEPERMISFDWNAPPSLPEARAQRSFVVIRISPIGDTTTLVKMHHVGWGDGGEWDKAYAYFDRAWGVVLGNLQRRFDSGALDWTEWMQDLEKAHRRSSK